MSNDVNLEDLVETPGVAQDADLQEMVEPIIQADSETQTLSAEGFPFELSLRRDCIDDYKELNKFIRNVETAIRRSPEYKVWTEYVREILGHFTCELTGEVHSQTNVDIHHHPISLFNIVKAVIMKKQESGAAFCSFDIATEVIELHYEDRVGYIPILSSLHDKFHNGFLHLPIEIVHGDYQYMVNNFDFDDDDKDVITGRMEINRENCGWSNYYWQRNQYGAQLEESDEA